MKKIMAIVLLAAATISTSAFGHWRHHNACCAEEYVTECCEETCDSCGYGYWY